MPWPSIVQAMRIVRNVPSFLGMVGSAGSGYEGCRYGRYCVSLLGIWDEERKGDC